MVRGLSILFLLTTAHAEEASHPKKVAGLALLGVSAAAAVFAMVSGAVTAQPVSGCTGTSDQPDCLFPHENAFLAAASLGGISALTLASGLPLYLGGRGDPSRRLALRRGGYAMMALAATATLVTVIGAALAFGCDPRTDCYGAGLIMSSGGASLAGASIATGVPLVTF